MKAPDPTKYLDHEMCGRPGCPWCAARQENRLIGVLEGIKTEIGCLGYLIIFISAVAICLAYQALAKL